LLLPLLLPSALSIMFLLGRVILSESEQYLFLFWNLFLAWLPLLWAWLLTQSLYDYPWSSWRPVTFSLLWLAFLPNSFYLVSDFTHLKAAEGISLLYDVVMLMSFALAAMLVGWVSVYMVQRLLKRRFTEQNVWAMLGVVFLLCSFAVYLGRFLGWNSWDIIFNPADILFDVSDRVLNPALYPNTFLTTSLFFAFISCTYLSFYGLVRALRSYK
jgi:uncharacterized membrane protein